MIGIQQETEIQKVLIGIAETFRSDHDWDKFIPCYPDRKTGKKPPVRGCKVNQPVSASKLADYPSMECLGLILGDRFIAFDQDGSTAITKFRELFSDFSLPETLWISSTPGNRECLIYEIPEDFQGKIKFQEIQTEAKEKLEIRTGSHYQILAGVHPYADLYQRKPLKVATLPIDVCQVLLNLQISSETNQSRNQSHFEKPEETIQHKIELAKQAIAFLEIAKDRRFLIDASEYGSWIKVGMIFHSIDSGLEGFQAWDDWSKTAPNYQQDPSNPDSTLRKWQTFKNEGKTISLGSLRRWFNECFRDTSEISEDIKAQYQSALNELNQLKGLRYSLIDAFEEDYTNAYLTNQISENRLISEWATEFRTPIPAIVTLWENFKREKELKAVATETKQAIAQSFAHPELLGVDGIFSTLPYGSTILEILKHRKIDPKIGLITLLTIASGVMPKERYYEVSKGLPMSGSLFMILNAETSKGKSVLMRLFAKPVIDMGKNNRFAFKDACDKYDEDMETWRSMPASDKRKIREIEQAKYAFSDTTDIGQLTEFELQSKPKKPERPRYWFVDQGTPEGVRDLVATQKSHALVWLCDELSQLFKNIQGYGQNKKARADYSDKAYLIRIWDNALITSENVTENKPSGVWQMSLLGNIQPGVFSMIINLDDDQGLIGRFLIIDGESLEVEHLDPNKPGARVFDFELQETYIKLGDLPVEIVTPTSKGFERWKAFDSKLRSLADKTEILGFRYWLNKAGQNTARIAGILNDLHCIQNPEQPTNKISDLAMTQAIQIGEWLLESHTKMFKHTSVDASVDPEKIDQYQAIKAYLIKHQDKPEGVTRKAIADCYKLKKAYNLPMSEVSVLLDDLVMLGEIERTSKGYKISDKQNII